MDQVLRLLRHVGDSDRILGNWLELGLSLDFAAMWTVNQQVDFVYLSPTPGFQVNNKFIQKKKIT